MIADMKSYNALVKQIRLLDSVLVAFSGGVDSTFLLKACHDALGDRVKAITVQTPYIPLWEIEEAKVIANAIGVSHEILQAEVSPEIIHNPENRCYLCKTFIFTTLLELAQKQGYDAVVDGSNFDDTKDYRPGLVALKELSIRSPLLEAGMTKMEIRELSKALDLQTWDKPAYACLLTRIPYGTELKETDFRMIEEAEQYMMSLGFRAVRIRKHDDLARIEVNPLERHRLFDEALLDQIAKELKLIGFSYVTMDLQGYRTGSLNTQMSTAVGGNI